MKIRHLVSFVTIAVCTLPIAAAPKWDAAHVKEVRFREGMPGKEVRAVDRPKEIEELLSCFRRATEVGKNAGKREWPKCIDIAGERPEDGRWLYDAASGEFCRLDPMVQRIHCLSDADRVRVNAYFEKKEANQTSAPTAPSGRGSS